MALFFLLLLFFFVDVYVTVTKTTNVWLHDQLQKTILMLPAGIEPCSSQGLMRHRVYTYGYRGKMNQNTEIGVVAYK